MDRVELSPGRVSSWDEIPHVSVPSSAFKDHAATEMHSRAMSLFRKQQCGSTNPVDFAPIAKALCKMDENAAAIAQRKFDITYLLCKEHIAFAKFESFCRLEEQHGVHLGTGGKNQVACATYADYIADSLKEQLTANLKRSHFFSVQTDGSTDAGNVEEEIYVALFFDPYGADGKVHVRSQFLGVLQPSTVDASELTACFERAMDLAGVDDWQTKLVGLGCDGASVNIAKNGLKGKLSEKVPWLVVVWCVAHRLELAIKDALTDTVFTEIDTMLLRIYYLYEKSSKKTRELDEIVESLRSCLEPMDMPSGSGNKPLRACGTRFVAHKLAAISRLIERFGAYISHLQAMTDDDSTTRAVDKAKMTGYINKWCTGKMLYGLAFFHDLLKPAAALCKALQSAEICVVTTIEALLSTVKAMELVKSSEFDELPTVKRLMERLRVQDDGKTTYQGVTIKRLEQGEELLRNHYEQYSFLVIDCLKNRVKAEHVDLLTDTLTVLATHGWGKSDDTDFGKSCVERLATRFESALVSASFSTASLQEEWEDMVSYAKKYLNLTDSHLIVWWKLFNVAESCRWRGMLLLAELLFCLPMSNGSVERMFSSLKHIKTDRRCRLNESRLDGLVRIAIDGPPPTQFKAQRAVELWWTDKCRRSSRNSSEATSDSASDQKSNELDLADWDAFLA